MGNILGSCITNLTLVLGVTALINPKGAALAPFMNLVIFMLIANQLLWYLLEGEKLKRREGNALFTVYALFILTSLWIERGG